MAMIRAQYVWPHTWLVNSRKQMGVRQLENDKKAGFWPYAVGGSPPAV